MSFTIPNAEQISEALGDIKQLPREMQLAITHGLDESFKPVPKPGEDDWLSCHSEKGQTMKAFERSSFKAVPHANYKTIYIQPMGSFNDPRAAPLDRVIKFVRAFFSGCEVELLAPVDFTPDMVHRNNFGIEQYRTDGFYNYLSQTRHKREARRELLCVAVTMADIYPEESWNFVYGQARVTDGLGVYSFARLDPLFGQSSQRKLATPLSEEHCIIIFRRCVKILLHEIGHLFGLRHCIYYICLMNGANHEIEMDRQPLYLCPVCLRKLHSTLKFNIQNLYKDFAELCEKYGLEEETQWYQNRLKCIQDNVK